VSRVVLHKLRGSKKAQDACRLIESLLEGGRRVVVWVSDEGRARVLDDYLWTFSQSSFVPHALVSSGTTCEDPAAIVSGVLENPNGADVLVVVDRVDDLAAASGFDEVHDLDAGTEEDQGKAEGWRAVGFDVDEVSGLGSG